MPLLLTSQRTPEWLAARVGRITSSNAAACLGLCPYTSRQKAYRLITGKEKEEDNPYMKWGREQEDNARGQYEILSGNLTSPGGFWVHPELHWLAASPDGLVDHDGGVEVKCPQTLPTKIPTHHKIQMIVQMIVTQRAWWDYFAWTRQGHFLARVSIGSGYPGLVHRLDQFRLKYLVPGVEPERNKPRRKRAKETAEQ